MTPIDKQDVAHMSTTRAELELLSRVLRNLVYSESVSLSDSERDIVNRKWFQVDAALKRLDTRNQVSPKGL